MRKPSPQVIRYCLALIVVILFVGVTVGAVCAPDAKVFYQLLAVLSPLVATIISYYFSEQDHK